jgi:hypothetical protein
MAVRIPLYNNAGNLQEMSASMITDIKNVFKYQFQAGNLVALSVVASGGNIGTITDSRLQAGAQSTSVSALPSEATTAEPSVVNVTYAKILQTVPATDTLTTDSGTLYPVYQDGSDIRAMTVTDMRDTFADPVVTELASSLNNETTAGTYFLQSNTTPLDANKELVSTTAVFTDTIADTTAYTAGAIPETLDQPSNVTSYYLHKNIMASPTFQPPMYITAAGHIQEYTSSTFSAMARQLMNINVTSIAGKTITYSLATSTSDYVKGTGMADTRLNGGGNYQTRFVGTDDYRAQEFPNGTATTINTYYLRLVLS